MTARTRRTLRYRYGAAVFLSLLLPFASPRADVDSGSDEAIIALSEYADGILISVRPASLVRIDIANRERKQLSLPASVERIASIATPATQDGRLYIAAPGSGVWGSADDGESWTPRNEGLPNKNVTGLASHADLSNTLYAFVPGKGIYRSEDASDSWQLMDGGPEDMTGTFVHTDMPGSMQTGWLFVATKAGISRSMDCFCLWRNTGTIAGKVYGLSYDPGQPAHIYAATDDGLFLSQDGGVRWEKLTAPVSFVTALIVTATGELYVGSADGELYRSVDQAASWEPIRGR